LKLKQFITKKQWHPYKITPAGPELIQINRFHDNN
jgi:uncharacterized protein YjhX (UPF0386 family)